MTEALIAVAILVAFSFASGAVYAMHRTRTLSEATDHLERWTGGWCETHGSFDGRPYASCRLAGGSR